jgi:hypothetical protein
MKRSQFSECTDGRFIGVFALVLILLTMMLSGTLAQAQNDRSIQILTGRIARGDRVLYDLPGLKTGTVLYVYTAGTSGNLDPLVALLAPGMDITTIRELFMAELDRAVAAGRDPLAAHPELAVKFTLIWNDDGGAGYGASFKYQIPEDGDYKLLVRSTLAQETFGEYRLIIGINAPEVLTGTAHPTGDEIAVLDRAASRAGRAVQIVEGNLSPDKPSTFYDLNIVHAGETLSVFIESTSGDLMPVLTLDDYGGKPIRSANTAGLEKMARLEYTFPGDGSGYQLIISGRRDDGTVTSGDYRLLVGINAPEVWEGRAVIVGEPALRQSTRVKVGLRLHQITNVNQKEENFGVVATLQMEWNDPALAFSPDSCQCRFRIFRGDDFVQYVVANRIRWPEFTLFNQQGRRWTQNQIVVVWPDGNVLYFERFSATLQAPDFDFRRFPFDTEQFFIRVDMLLPEDYYVFDMLEDFSEVGTQLGEEEWIITEHDTSITRERGSTRQYSSRFSFRFEARRHLNYYIFRIFIPLLIILAVSWVTFFLRDFNKRVDVSSGTLLVFIAFNFTISDDLPRLGYVTLLDSILVCAFIVTSLSVVFNVYLRRLEVDRKKSFANRIDKYMIWLYPLAYAIAVLGVTLFFS